MPKTPNANPTERTGPARPGKAASHLDGQFDLRIDAYIDRAQPFAQPILTHLRALIHKACPAVEEDIKWSRPFFSHHGQILCNISGFKAHCSCGFWGAEIASQLKEDGVLEPGAMGSLGRITSLADLPPDKALIAYLRKGAAYIESGQGANRVVVARRVAKVHKPAPETPPELTAALAKNQVAAQAFAAFSPSCRREYTEWIADAKRPETRDRRITQAIAWIAEGKQRNWKYENC